MTSRSTVSHMFLLEAWEPQVAVEGLAGLQALMHLLSLNGSAWLGSQLLTHSDLIR